MRRLAAHFGPGADVAGVGTASLRRWAEETWGQRKPRQASSTPRARPARASLAITQQATARTHAAKAAAVIHDPVHARGAHAASSCYGA